MPQSAAAKDAHKQESEIADAVQREQEVRFAGVSLSREAALISAIAWKA